MPRPHKPRCIRQGAVASCYKPAGVPGRTLETVELRLDEMEAIRLADFDGLYLEEAAARRGISRATFGRLVEAARHKVADALLYRKMLMLKGGNVTMSETRTFECAACGHRFARPYGRPRPAECPRCGQTDIHRAAEERGRGGQGQGARGGAGRRGGRGRNRRGRGAGRGRANDGITVLGVPGASSSRPESKGAADTDKEPNE